MADTKYLERRGNRWHCVVYVPKPLRASLGKKKLSISLRTESLRVAQDRRHAIVHEFKQRIHTERQRQNGGLIGEAIKWREDYLKASNQRPPPDTNDPRDERQSDREIIKDMISDEAHQLADGGDEEDASLFFEIATGHGTLVSDARDRWLREEGENYREQTVRQHRRAFEVFLKWAGPMTLTSTVDRKKAGEFILQHLVETSGLKPKTINRYISHLSSGWEWMIRRGLVEDNVWLRQSVRVGKSTDERGAMT